MQTRKVHRGKGYSIYLRCDQEFAGVSLAPYYFASSASWRDKSNETLLQNGAGRERTGNWGSEVLNMTESAERNVPRNGNFVRAILEFANKWLKSKKGR